MIRLNIKVVATSVSESHGRIEERVLHDFKTDQYDIFEVNKLITEALGKAQISAGFSSLQELKSLAPEVVISLFVEEEPIRPALHFNAETIRDLADAGASVDFDPYVYE